MAKTVPTRKQAVNVTLPASLLREAKRRDVNLSATLERALAVEVRARRSAEWRAANRAAIEAYNADVDAHGTFADKLRSF